MSVDAGARPKGREAFDRRDWAAAFRPALRPPASRLAEDDHGAARDMAAYPGRRRRRRGPGLAARLPGSRWMPATALGAVRCRLLARAGAQRHAASCAVGGGWVGPRATAARGRARATSSNAATCSSTSSTSTSVAGDLARAPRRPPPRIVRVRSPSSAMPDLVAQGLVRPGPVAIYAGRVPEGLALLDEAMVGVSAAEVSPVIAGHGLLRGDRGLPGDRRTISRMSRMDEGADPVVRDPTRPGALHRPVLAASRPDPAAARCLRGRPRRVRAWPSSEPRPGRRPAAAALRRAR